MCKKSTELKDDIANMLVELMGNEIGNICSIDKVESKMIDINSGYQCMLQGILENYINYSLVLIVLDH